jgi:hypothetical protein
MTDHSQQDLRQAAAKAFAESLEQLQETLEADDRAPAPTESDSAVEARSAVKFDLLSLEQAAADIEQFIQQQTKLDRDETSQ